MQPLRVDLREFRERFEALTDVAHTNPVVITDTGEDALVVMSSKEWRRLRRNERHVGLTSELSDAWLEAVEAAQVPGAFSHLDRELKTCFGG